MSDSWFSIAMTGAYMRKRGANQSQSWYCDGCERHTEHWIQNENGLGDKLDPSGWTDRYGIRVYVQYPVCDCGCSLETYALDAADLDKLVNKLKNIEQELKSLRGFKTAVENAVAKFT